MELEIIKKLNNINENDFINFDEDIKNIEIKTGIKFPKILFDFYKQIGIHSNIFKSVLNGLKHNSLGILELHIDDHTGDKWGLNTNNNLLFKPFKRKWSNTKYSVQDFLINEVLKITCFNQNFTARGKCSNNELKKAINDGFLFEIESKEIHIEAANIYDLNMNFYQSSANDIIAIGEESIYYGVNNRVDLDNFTSLFGKDWYLALWLGGDKL
ncbi:hypothetical protein [Tenacibaculum aiptasiae]|uniref:hypothetical protein n=1 Tax=Tenacibaculum aiptasiae TaxID=426481 RepID=UPI00232A8F21|nr:hypothetical protein [Tenacibaculum aiptasiae]